MSKLLTTKEVQELLHIDRSTVYRMVEAGRLPGVKVGKQWRFPADQIDRWIHQQSAPAGNGSSSPTETDEAQDFASMLPLECVQLIQDTFAEALSVMIVITDMAGNPVTEVSNPCGLFEVVSQTPDGLQKCIAGWGDMAAILEMEPQLTPSHLGLLGTRGLVRSGTALQGMVVVGGIAPDTWPPDANQVEAMALDLGLSSEVLTPYLSDVFYLDAGQRTQVVSLVQRIANILTHIVAERTVLTGKLASIAKLVTIS